LVDAFTAAHTTTFLDLDNIALNDTSYFKAAHPVTITNTGSTDQTYTFANLLAATAYTLTGAITPDIFPPNLDASSTAGATIPFNPETITVLARSSGIVTLHFTRPEGLDATRIPVYSGYVAINGSNGDTLSLPYAGIASRLKDAKIINTAAGYPFLSSSANILTPIITNDTIFVVPGPNSSTPPSSSIAFPSIIYNLAMGSRIIRVDIQPEDPRGLDRIIGQQVLGSVPGYPVENHARNSLDAAVWDGPMADGSWAPEGKYRFMLRALRILGVVDYDHDYERFVSGVFEVRYAK
jgi:hypothetical protein